MRKGERRRERIKESRGAYRQRETKVRRGFY
jgi:hypothetical protein